MLSIIKKKLNPTSYKICKNDKTIASILCGHQLGLMKEKSALQSTS